MRIIYIEIGMIMLMQIHNLINYDYTPMSYLSDLIALLLGISFAILNDYNFNNNQVSLGAIEASLGTWIIKDFTDKFKEK